jgi:hypothetical protein
VLGLLLGSVGWVLPHFSLDIYPKIRRRLIVIMRVMPTTLKEARQKGKLDEFIKEHEQDSKGDKDKLDKTISSLVQNKSKSTRGTSQKD